MKHNLIKSAIAILVIMLTGQILFAANVTPATKSVATPTTTPAQTTEPKLNPGEYSIFIEDQYKTFKTKKYQKLEITADCFKKEKPSCMAFTASQSKPAPAKLDIPEATNIAAVNCTNVGGKNMIAKNYKNDQYSFCRFSDGSMITAWSMYFKYNPVPVIR